MVMTTQNVSAILRPEEVGALLLEPLAQMSVAMRVSTAVSTGAAEFRIPMMTENPSAAWLTEAEEIPLSDAAMSELVVAPSKLAGLVVVSREAVEDTSPDAARVIGDSLARDIARKVDAAYFGSVAPPAPGGLETLAGLSEVASTGDNLDSFAEAISLAEGVGAQLTSFVAGPGTALALAQLKDETGSNRPLLGTDPTMPTRRQLLGLPLYVSPAVSAGIVWGIPTAWTFIVTRTDVRVERSDHAFFSSDSIGVRASLRIGFAYPSQPAIVKITVA